MSEERFARTWAEEQADTRRRSGIDGPGVDPADRPEQPRPRIVDTLSATEQRELYLLLDLGSEFADREAALREKAARRWTDDEDVAVCVAEIDRLRGIIVAAYVSPDRSD